MESFYYNIFPIDIIENILNRLYWNDFCVAYETIRNARGGYMGKYSVNFLRRKIAMDMPDAVRLIPALLEDPDPLEIYRKYMTVDVSSNIDRNDEGFGDIYVIDSEVLIVINKLGSSLNIIRGNISFRVVNQITTCNYWDSIVEEIYIKIDPSRCCISRGKIGYYDSIFNGEKNIEKFLQHNGVYDILKSSCRIGKFQDIKKFINKNTLSNI